MTELFIDSKELNKLISLLQEYTNKLREVCEHREETRFRLIKIAGIAGVLTAGMMSFLLYVSYENPSIQMAATFAVIPTIAIVFLTMYLTMKRSRFGFSYDGDRIAASVERLVRLASQMNEHSKKSVSDTFELDLRIAEAEGALRYYQRVFQVQSDWTRKD